MRLERDRLHKFTPVSYFMLSSSRWRSWS